MRRHVELFSYSHAMLLLHGAAGAEQALGRREPVPVLLTMPAGGLVQSACVTVTTFCRGCSGENESSSSAARREDLCECAEGQSEARVPAGAR